MKALAKRVILFGIDGGGTFFEQANTPNLDRIFKDGAVSRRTLTELPSISAECWGSILHGVDCRRHALTNWIAGHRPFPADSPYPSVFRVIRENMPDAQMASFCDWKAINIGIVEDGLGVEKLNAPDRDLVEPAVEYILNHDFTFFFLHFDSVDHAGHAFGYGAPEYLEALQRNDAYVGRIVETIERRGWLEDTLIIVEADHGGTPGDGMGRGGSHGGDTDAEKYVCFMAAGGGAQKAELRDMLTRDTAPAILHALGLEAPAAWNSRVPGGLFADIPENLPRPEGLRPAVSSARPRPEDGRFAERFSDLGPLVHLSFEGPAMLPPEAERVGKLYPVEGVRGQAIRLDDGGFSLPCPALEDGFSLLGWMRLEAVPAHAVVAGTHPHHFQASESETGFCLCVRRDYGFISLILRAAGAVKPLVIDLPLPPGAEGGWTHFAVIVSADRDSVGVSLNFEPIIRQSLRPGALQPDGPTRRLYVGMNGPETENPERLPAALDDLCLCRRALTDADLSRLKAYYAGADGEG